MDTDARRVSLLEAFLASLRKGALNLIIVIAHEGLALCLREIGSEGPLVLLVQVLEVPLGLEELNDLVLDRRVGKELLHTHI